MSQASDAEFVAVQSALMGEYSLDREIGRGGMGVVYLAREVRLARPVAIKVLPPALASRPQLREAFLRESQIVARLNHPNIVPVYSAGESGGFVYIVMAYVEGITLGERIRTRGPLIPGQAARMLREVCWALAYAHAAGIVHRDVSAENILLERGTERAIVMDFGIASVMQSSALSDDGRVMGNAHYVSPEQAIGEPVDARSDLYSLGICGFYALTGQLPFDAETPGEVVQQQLTKPAPPVTSLASAVPGRLGQAVDKCLNKERLRRYRNAESFAEAIDLAFEHAREIPAPLRVWIGEGEREVPARLGLVGIGASVGTIMSLVSLNSFLFFIPTGITLAVSMIPFMQRLRRVLKVGFHIDDLSIALRDHQLARSEELAFLLTQRSPRVRSALRILLGASAGGAGLSVYLLYLADAFSTGRFLYNGAQLQIQETLLTALVGSMSVFVAAAVPLAADFLRFRLSAKMSSVSISFWKGKWAARLAKLASIGLKPSERPVLGLPLLTEVALGRATDHLYQALPKAARKQLATLPATVRGLEEDASALRQSINEFDEQLIIFDRDVSSDAPERVVIERELRDARALAASRLGATVSAIENIRLDLLRLQMGAAGIESVTASLDAAQRVGELIVAAAEAQEEVERFLASPTGARRDGLAEATDEQDDDDADTPIHGVTAASV